MKIAEFNAKYAPYSITQIWVHHAAVPTSLPLQRLLEQEKGEDMLALVAEFTTSKKYLLDLRWHNQSLVVFTCSKAVYDADEVLLKVRHSMVCHSLKLHLQHFYHSLLNYVPRFTRTPRQ